MERSDPGHTVTGCRSHHVATRSNVSLTAGYWMRVLLIDASGQLGQDLLTNNPSHEIVAPSRHELDLARPDQISRITREVQPDFVINCAAFHNVPLCEQQVAEAFLINCIGLRD